jgi:hypothetical protein
LIHVQHLLLLAASALIQDPAPAPFRFLDVRTSPVIELYYEVRARAEKEETAPADDPLAAPIALVRALATDLGFFLNWGFLEGHLLDCNDANDLTRAFGDAPESFHVRTPEGTTREIALRARALEVASALEQAWPAWHEKVWPERESALTAEAARLNELFSGERGEAVWNALCEHLLIDVEPLVVPVYLTTRGPFPGAVTHRAFSGAVSFVALQDVSGSLLHESILHESLHALDEASTGHATLLERLRARLAEAGFDERDRRSHDAVHTLMFLDAAETVRETLDPAHRDYGDQRDYYSKVQAIADLERPLWRKWIEHDIDADAFLDAITKGMTREKAPRP